MTDAEAPFVNELQDNDKENKVSFTFKTTNDLAGELSSGLAYKKLKLSISFSTSNMVLFDCRRTHLQV